MKEEFVLVQKKKSPVFLFLALLCLALAIGSMYIACMIPMAFTLVVVFGFGFFEFQFRCNKEWEYSYFDGDIRFAKIMNKSRRKQLKNYSTSDLVQIAPAGDDSVRHFENDSNVKKVNYTSCVAGVPYYDMVIRTSEETLLFMVELDDNYLDAVCIKNASKVIRRR